MTASAMTSVADPRPADFREHELPPADLAEIDLGEEDFSAAPGGRASLAEGNALSGNDSELSSDAASDLSSDLWLYRDRTVGMLRRYMRLAIEVGRLPSLLGREFFRTRVTSYHASTFEDAVIFVHDVERSLEILDEFERKLIAKIVLQEYSQEEAGRLLDRFQSFYKA